MFDQDKFHNTLALSLGYAQMFKDNQITIIIEYNEVSDDPIVEIDVLNGRVKISYYASSTNEDVWQKNILPRQKEIINAHDIRKEIDTIIDSTHQAYLKAITAIA